MRTYRNDRNEKNSVLICNKCGKKLLLANGTVMEGVCSVEVDWGYFSRKDGEHHAFDLCEECYDQFVKNFRIPVEIRENTELV